jgi:hypothetical protein
MLRKSSGRGWDEVRDVVPNLRRGRFTKFRTEDGTIHHLATSIPDYLAASLVWPGSLWGCEEVTDLHSVVQNLQQCWPCLHNLWIVIA